MTNASQRNLKMRRLTQQRKNNNEVIDKKFNIVLLNSLVKYAISDNPKITRHGMENLRLLMSMVDPSIYTTNPESLECIDIINKAIEARIKYGLTRRDLIVAHVNGGLLGTNNYSIPSDDISNESIKWVDENVSNLLKYKNLISYADEMIDIGTRLKSDIIDPSLVGEFEGLVDTVGTTMRKLTPETDNETKFSLQEGLFNDSIARTYRSLKSNTNKLKTGMVGLNSLLKGGFEKTRVYLILGVTGGGKSMALLNLACQMKKANMGYKPNDPTKTPAIIYMTMENDIQESIHRLYQISTGRDDMTDIPLDDVVANIRNSGMEINEAENNNIDLLMEYVPAKSINTNAMLKMVEDYEDNGYEIICFIQDHIKKINSSEPKNSKTELRVELGEIINQMKVIATKKNIPVITNSHLNRDANRKVEEAMSANKSDKIKLITRDNIGESLLMLDNTDVGMVVTIEDNNPDEKYMGFKILKSRDGIGLNSNTIFQPFISPDAVKLTEDCNLPNPLFKTTLNMDGLESNQFNTGKDNIKVSPYAINSINDLSQNIDTTQMYTYSDGEK